VLNKATHCYDFKQIIVRSQFQFPCSVRVP